MTDAGWKRLAALVGLSCGALIALVWVLVEHEIEVQFQNAVEAAVTEDSNLAGAISVHMSTAFERVSGSLLWVRREFAASGDVEDLARRGMWDPSGRSGIRRLVVLDDRGAVRSVHPDPGALDLPASEIVESHRADASAAARVSVIDRRGRGAAAGMPVSMRLDRPDGTFGGAVVAVLGPGFFTRVQGALDHGGGIRVLLADVDGNVHLEPEQDQPAVRDARARALRDWLARAPAGNFAFPDAIDGAVRRSSYRALEGHRLVVVVERSSLALRAALASHVRTLRAAAVLVSALVATLGLVLGTTWYRQRSMYRSLAASEDRFRALTQLASDWYWEQDAAFRFTEVGGGNRESAGAASHDRPGLQRWDNPDVTPVGTTWEEHRAVLARHERFHDLLLRYRTPEGETRYTSVSGEPVIAPGGAFAGYRGVARDVSDRVRLQQRLGVDQTVTRLLATCRSVREALPGVIEALCRGLGWEWGARWEVDRSAGTIVCIESWCDGRIADSEFVEVSAGGRFALRAGGLMARTYESGEPRWEANVAAAQGFRRRELALAAGLRGVVAIPILVGDRAIGVMEFMTVEVRHPDVLLLDTMAAIGRHLGQFMEKLEAEAAVAEGRERLRLALEGAGLAMFDWNIASREVFLSEGWAEILGRTLSPTIAAFPELDAIVHPDDRERLRVEIRETLKGVRPNYRAEHRVRADSGEWVWIETRGRVTVRDDDGRAARMVGVVADITDRKGMEAEIGRLNAELERRVVERTAQLEVANRELESFSYSVAHDLRAPLRAIDGYSRLLLDDEEGAAGRDACVSRIRMGVARMSSLIDDLLELARMSRSELRIDDVCLSRLATEILGELAGGEPERRSEVSIEPDVTARGDPRLLRVALENLLSNAWKYTSRRDVARIEFGIEPCPGGASCYYVRDNGAGFDMSHARRLFGVFQRLHHESEFPGNGIGLATVQRIVRRHGGKVSAMAAPDLGATFRFTLWETAGDAVVS